MRQEIRLAGFGGQGVISMGIIIANAAGKFEEKEVAQTQSYGPEARGGACKTEVVLSDREIDYIKTLKPDIFVAMSQPALDKYVGDLDGEKSLLIVDSTLVDSIPSHLKSVYKVPATKIAEEELGLRVVANVFMLGALVRISGLVTYDSCQKALTENMPVRTLDENLSAFQAGYQYAESIL
ncbi:MAG: 2-oxoacid:acceptor oxidoreductase family protein [Desulfitobacteriaceae bacterium]